MARNNVQFQKGLSETKFENLYGTEDKCWAKLVAWRWPKGFECPKCGGHKYCVVGSRRLFQCAACRSQTSITAGTIFDSTKLPLKTWFRAMYHLTQTKGGISSMELARRLGVTQNTAWKLSHKLMQVMFEREGEKPLRGRVELDDAYLGGKRSGGKRGRGASGKTPFIAAIETTPEGQPTQMKLCTVRRFHAEDVKKAAGRVLSDTCTVITDGLRCFRIIAAIGCQHHPCPTKHDKRIQNTTFKWVNTVLGNVKSAITGTYRAIRPKHVSRYLSSFAYRFNRRFNLASMIVRLAWVSTRTPPMPYRLLKMAEVGA